MSGDPVATKIVGAVILPPTKAVPQSQSFELSGDTLTEKSHVVVQVMADGKVSIDDGARLLQALGAVAHIVEIDEVLRRIAALEDIAKRRTGGRS